MPYKNIHSAIGFLDVKGVTAFLKEDPKSTLELGYKGITVLHRLVATTPIRSKDIEEFNQIAQLLMDYKANPFLVDQDGRTPLDLAIQLNLCPACIITLETYMTNYTVTQSNASATKNTITPAATLYQRHKKTSSPSNSLASSTSSNTNTEPNYLQDIINTLVSFTH